MTEPYLNITPSWVTLVQVGDWLIRTRHAIFNGSAELLLGTGSEPCCSVWQGSRGWGYPWGHDKGWDPSEDEGGSPGLGYVNIYRLD